MSGLPSVADILGGVEYEEPIAARWSDVASASLRRDEEAVLRTLLGAVIAEPDWRRAQDECLRLLQHDEPAVRRLAVTCLGHVARIHGQIDRPRVLAALDQAASSDPGVAGQVADARDDIDHFTQ